ncbi:hypothetical protein Pfo_013816 [Paulownia fortunei]|nr:hypothetical protein Pfo_013816 [Paulownia fortunei]
MASEQMRRENVTDERHIVVEKDRVPKMTTHFESLAEKAREEEQHIPLHGEKVHQFDTLPVGVISGLKLSGSAETESERKRSEEGQVKEGEAEKWVSQIHARREEKEQQAGEYGRERRDEMQGKEEGEHGKEENYGREGGGERIKGPSLEEISNLRATAQQNSMVAIRAAEERYEKAKEAGALALQKAKEAKDYTADKAMETKDVVISKGQSAAQYTAEKAKAAKDTTADTTTKRAAGYVGEKAVAAKDVVVDSGKGAAGYVGKVATEVKDQAVVAGWGATHYTLEKVAEATKAVAGVTSSVAGYTGEKAVAAKDKVAGAGKTVVGYAGEKIAAAKDAVVATEENAAEYAARKKAEAQKDLETRKASHEKGDGGETIASKEQYATKEQWERPPENFLEFFQGGAEEQGQQQEGGSILQAIGQTIVEIGQTTKELLSGQYPMQVLQQKDEAKFTEEPHLRAGKGT